MTRVWLAIVVALAVLGSAPEGQARSSNGAVNASIDDTQLLKRRFLAAQRAARMPESFDHIDSLIEIIRAIEKDFSLNLRSREMILTVSESEPRFKAMYGEEATKGIAHYRPLEKASRASEKQQKNWLVEALGYSAICIPSDADYNLRYLDYLGRRPWKANSESIRYAISFRMFKRDCVSKRDFLARTEVLVPVLRKAMMQPELEAGDAGAYIYLLAASDRLDLVPQKLLTRYLNAQEQGGWWKDKQVGDPSVAAAQGAYVVAKMLELRNVYITEMELFQAGREPPKLPGPSSF